MSDENNTVAQATAAEDEDRTVNVRLTNPLPPKVEEVVEDDRTVNIRVEKLLNDPRMQAKPATHTGASQIRNAGQGAALNGGTIPVEENPPETNPTRTRILIPALLIGGGILGWFADKALGNTGVPWGLIIGLLLGGAGSAVVAMRKPT